MSLVNLLIAARSAVQGWRQRERAYGELMALDDRSLSDIGIHRSEIPALIEGFREAGQPAPEPALTAAATRNARQSRLASAHRWLPPL
jgi:uncharacterized protein YjiS (DUF1127 family)